MSKGRRSKALIAMANRKRNPESWSNAPVIITKVKKNRVLALLPKNGSGRGRNA